MLCALPLAAWGMFFRGGEYIKHSIAAYAAFGVVLMIGIARM